MKRKSSQIDEQLSQPTMNSEKSKQAIHCANLSTEIERFQTASIAPSRLKSLVNNLISLISMDQVGNVINLLQQSAIPTRLIALADVMLHLHVYLNFDDRVRLFRVNQEWRRAILQPSCWTTFYGTQSEWDKTPLEDRVYQHPYHPINQFRFPAVFIQRMSHTWSKVKLKALYLSSTVKEPNTFALAQWLPEIAFANVEGLYINYIYDGSLNQLNSALTILTRCSLFLKKLNLSFCNIPVHLFPQVNLPSLVEYIAHSDASLSTMFVNAPNLEILCISPGNNTDQKTDCLCFDVLYPKLQTLVLSSNLKRAIAQKVIEKIAKYKSLILSLPSTLQCIKIDSIHLLHIPWFATQTSLTYTLLFNPKVLGDFNEVYQLPALDGIISSFSPQSLYSISHLEIQIYLGLMEQDVNVLDKTQSWSRFIARKMSHLKSLTWKFLKCAGVRNLPRKVLDSTRAIFLDENKQHIDVFLSEC